jgi:hemolysin activation/secretion protein
MLYASSTIHAQPGEIDAGQIINQIENNDPQSIDPAPQLPEVNADPAPSSSDIKVNLKNIQFSGNQALANEIIQEFLAQYLNTPLTVEQIKSIPSNLSLFYRQNNLIAEITLPDQDITEGDLVIEIMEAQMGEVTIESNDEVSIKKNYLKQYFRKQ